MGELFQHLKTPRNGVLRMGPKSVWLSRCYFSVLCCFDPYRSGTIQKLDVHSLPLTDKVYGLLKVGANVGHVTVLHRDPLVVVVTLGRLQVPA